MTSIYTPEGYLNVPLLESHSAVFNIVIGGRGTGKTYGLLRYYIEQRKPIIYMRRTAEQARISGSTAFCPYRTVCDDVGAEYKLLAGKPRTVMINGEKAAYIVALSTIGNIRGFDASDCAAVIYDEFIPEKSGITIKDELTSLYNAYETINRNRELEGTSPVKMWLLTNANTINSPILTGLGLIPTLRRMYTKQQEVYYDTSRSLAVYVLQHSPVSERKKQTALYQLSGDTYKSMAIDNIFPPPPENIRPRSLKGLAPIFYIRGYVGYMDNDGLYYICRHVSGKPRKYNDNQIKSLHKDNPMLRIDTEMELVDYETEEIYYGFRQLIL